MVVVTTDDVEDRIGQIDAITEHVVDAFKEGIGAVSGTIVLVVGDVVPTETRHVLLRDGVAHLQPNREDLGVVLGTIPTIRDDARIRVVILILRVHYRRSTQQAGRIERSNQRVGGSDRHALHRHQFQLERTEQKSLRSIVEKALVLTVDLAEQHHVATVVGGLRSVQAQAGQTVPRLDVRGTVVDLVGVAWSA